jgi:hypothetical protein
MYNKNKMDNFDLKKYLAENKLNEDEGISSFENIDVDMDQDFKNDFINLIENITNDLSEQGGYDLDFIKEYLKYLVDKN